MAEEKKKIPVISTTPEQDASRKAIILDYVLKNTEPDPALVPKMFIYTEGNNKTLGYYTRVHDLLTGYVEYLRYKSRDWNEETYKPVSQRIHGYGSYNNYEKYTRPCPDCVKKVCYAKRVPATDTTEGFVEIGVIRIPIGNLDKKVNVDKRKYTFCSTSRVFLFDNDPMPYGENGNKAWKTSNNTKYNKGFFEYLCNTFKYNVANKHADEELSKFFGLTEPTGYWAIANMYKNMRPKVTSKLTKLEKKGLIVTFSNKRPEFDKFYICPTERGGHEVPTSYWFLEDATDGGKYLIHYTRKYEYRTAVEQFVDDHAPMYDSPKKICKIDISQIKADPKIFKVEDNPDYIHISPKGEIAIIGWNQAANQYESRRVSTSRYWGYGSSIFFDVDKWNKDPIIGTALNGKCEEVSRNSQIQTLIANINFPLRAAIAEKFPDLKEWLACCTNAFIERLFGKIDWKSTDYAKQLRFSHFQINYMNLWMMNHKKSWNRYQALDNTIKIMFQLYGADKIASVDYKEFEEHFNVFADAIESNVIHAGWGHRNTDGLMCYENRVYRDFYKLVSSGKMPSYAWSQVCKQYNL